MKTRKPTLLICTIVTAFALSYLSLTLSNFHLAHAHDPCRDEARKMREAGKALQTAKTNLTNATNDNNKTAGGKVGGGLAITVGTGGNPLGLIASFVAITVSGSDPVERAQAAVDSAQETFDDAWDAWVACEDRAHPG